MSEESTDPSPMASSPVEMETALVGAAQGTSSSSQALKANTANNVSYKDAIAQRRAALDQAVIAAAAKGQSYLFEPVLHFPHGVPVNASYLPRGSAHLYTSSDGYIRNYALLDSLNGCSQPAAGSGKPLEGATSNAILLSYFENTDSEDVTALQKKDRLSKARFGPRPVGELTQKTGNFAVHSLVVQQEELWALGGSENGSINLFGIRMDEGHVRHTFAPTKLESSTTHKMDQPISALALALDETTFCSGGWDKKVLQWDLNTGQCIRNFIGPTNQITSLAHRPVSTIDSAQPMDEDPNESYDPLFDDDKSSGEEDVEALKPKSTPKEMVDRSARSLSSDVLLGTCVNGQALLWDRRAACKEASELKRGENTPPWAVQAIWSLDGQEVLIGRRNASIDVYDLRTLKCRTLRLPEASGPVTALSLMPDGQHLACGSRDVIRMWDLKAQEDSRSLPYKVATTAHSGTISSLHMDYKGRFMVAAFGDRGFARDSAGYMDGVSVHARMPTL